jgi:hypothetical protein
MSVDRVLAHRVAIVNEESATWRRIKSGSLGMARESIAELHAEAWHRAVAIT